MIKDRETTKNVLAIIIVIALFILVSYLTKIYSTEIRQMVFLDGILGMTLYVLVTIMGVVFAPVSTLPFLALASVLWGGFISAILSIIGWVIGSAIAFKLARKYGRPLVSKFINVKKIEHFENIIPPKHVFWTIVFLRIALPVDLLSYSIGLLTKIPFSIFMYATVIGLTPFAFIFAYAVNLPIYYQVIAGALGVIAIFIGLKCAKKNLIFTKEKDDTPQT